MKSDNEQEQHILDTWHCNAGPWTEAVREHQIRSRREVTDQAIIEAVTSLNPHTALDIGCGEGWLARRLHRQGIQVTGIDAIAALIETARKAGGGDFRLIAYEALSEGKLDVKSDVAICNFSLLGKRSVQMLLKAIPAQLNAHGHLVIQTLHPVIACGDAPYQDGWRAGSWAGFGDRFTNPAPWYFRTLASWLALLSESGFTVVRIQEPLDKTTGKPASVVFIARAQA